ncbi:TPA: peptide chain release factor N(5)-glutamine methyltransferase [Campylobacter fetus subsp. venerealis]|uniref:peptide chain release factor N(5)-glutamine methyltransferase n=1 Tax=Campylobacter fetus subsp. venerealis NCTC 10354 TaxID=983328 RepID=A0AAE6IY87_CAMFE|nr:peptide chain release factor N(5)-glutamine methyltransferase [Campylobacter fetus]OCS22291.1 protein-(glutamine-N5) methyltransferase, release factor-specific [Campylobacter fetus subsp. venerealis cfvi97/532]OCS26092.1 protein-(glutamine-N5) methyltransferase, release factor-specific [Campylobacter fetus subsp. venerealis cfvB10]OCS29397.1 protein-(glutamine-N5) methyltransferase, release factor-specific [Campylobacter fetus subsp. venerealis LMG 6570 = CCUG 33900]OCS40106.1 protein-(gluta
MKIADALQRAKELGGSNLAFSLMGFHLKKDREWIFLHKEDKLDFVDEFLILLDRYKNGEPLQYITRSCDFLDYEFEVGRGVLVPRYETEILVQKVASIAKNLENISICEIGIGSGVISISLAKILKNCKFTATDISEDALKYARKNISKFGVQIELFNTSFLDGVEGDFDIIVSNPPYIAKDYKLDKWVMSEPSQALFGGEKGDEILKKIVNLAKDRTKFLVCEMGYDQKASLSNELEKAGFKFEFYKDLAGFDRGFVAYR